VGGNGNLQLPENAASVRLSQYSKNRSRFRAVALIGFVLRLAALVQDHPTSILTGSLPKLALSLFARPHHLELQYLDWIVVIVAPNVFIALRLTMTSRDDPS
jgi:hypothetical protein